MLSCRSLALHLCVVLTLATSLACSDSGLKPLLEDPADTVDEPAPGTTPPASGDTPTPDDQTDPPSPPPTDLPDPSTPPPADVDSDGDGLLDSEEDALGTDPNLADSDGDGWDDLEELDENTDPLVGSSHPYTGGWAIGDCNDAISSTGNSPGQVAQDFTLTDQYGDTVRLHDFCDRAVLLVSSASWCGPCQSEAGELQFMYDDLAAQGFIPITLLGEGNATSWANTFGLDYPVLSDPGYAITGRFVGPGSFSLPSMHLLGPGMEVITVESWVSEGAVIAALP